MKKIKVITSDSATGLEIEINSFLDMVAPDKLVTILYSTSAAGSGTMNYSALLVMELKRWSLNFSTKRKVFFSTGKGTV